MPSGGVTPHSIKMARLGVTQGHRVLQLGEEVAVGHKLSFVRDHVIVE